jgi:hypothetical protein
VVRLVRLAAVIHSSLKSQAGLIVTRL